MKSISIFLLTIVLIVGTAGCGAAPPVEYSLTVAVAPSGSGTATDLTNASPYAEGASVSIKAVASEGYRFVNWTAPAGVFGSATAAATTFTMPAQNVTVTANFMGVYDLTVVADPAGEGTATDLSNGSPYAEGASVSIKAVAAEGCHFVNWTAPAGTFANANATQTIFTMPARDVAVSANFGSGPTIPLKNPGTFVQMTIGDVDSLDPSWLYDTASGEQVQYIYETLLFYDRDKTDQFVPVLATEWEFDGESLTYRFKIREGVKFHEGGDLTPEDVEYSFERALIQDRDGGPVWMLFYSLLGLSGSRDQDGNIQVTFDQIDDAVEVDGDWVQFNPVAPAYPTLAVYQILCTPCASIVDKEWCIAHGDWDGSEGTWQDYNRPDVIDSYLYNHTNGTGPWKLEEREPGVQIKLARNDDYWGDAAPFDYIITQIVDEWTTRKEALLVGDADFVYVPGMYIHELEGIGDLNVYEDLPLLQIDAFFFNFGIATDSGYIGSGALDGEGIPPDFFADVDVRRGFCYAFDYETYLQDVLLGEGGQRGSPVVEGLAYYNPNSPKYTHDLTKAADYLRAAWNGTLWEKGFKLTLLYHPGNLPRETACRILAENLLAINPKFEVSVETTAWETYLDKIWGTRDMPMFQIGWIADYPHPNNLVFPFMASYGAFAQLQSYGYPELDELIQGAFKELDPSLQQDMYYDLQERYYEDAPSIMLVQPLGRRYFTKYIEGFYFNPMIPGQAGPLYYMSKSES